MNAKRLRKNALMLLLSQWQCGKNNTKHEGGGIAFEKVCQYLAIYHKQAVN